MADISKIVTLDNTTYNIKDATARTAKADKVANATSGNFAALDSNGNLTDSGHKHSDYALKVDIASAYIYRGSVSTYEDLPSTNLTAGDVYNVETDGQNYAWTGTAWDALGGSFSIDYITSSDVDEICV